VHRLIALNRSPGRVKFPEALLGVDLAFDRPIVLLDDVVQVLDGSMAALAAQYPFLFNSRALRQFPVERKKSRAPKRPYEGDLIQATAYCVLVEENYGRTPPFMRIQYADACFDEPYTAERKQWVLRTCEQIRQARRRRIANRSHTMPGKCRACGQRLNCDQAL
jgi:CRISPR-associated exonuclease Cas4